MVKSASELEDECKAFLRAAPDYYLKHADTVDRMLQSNQFVAFFIVLFSFDSFLWKNWNIIANMEEYSPILAEVIETNNEIRSSLFEKLLQDSKSLLPKELAAIIPEDRLAWDKEKDLLENLTANAPVIAEVLVRNPQVIFSSVLGLFGNYKALASKSYKRIKDSPEWVKDLMAEKLSSSMLQIIYSQYENLDITKDRLDKMIPHVLGEFDRMSQIVENLYRQITKQTGYKLSEKEKELIQDLSGRIVQKLQEQHGIIRRGELHGLDGEVELDDHVVLAQKKKLEAFLDDPQNFTLEKVLNKMGLNKEAFEKAVRFIKNPSKEGPSAIIEAMSDNFSQLDYGAMAEPMITEALVTELQSQNFSPAGAHFIASNTGVLISKAIFHPEELEKTALHLATSAAEEAKKLLDPLKSIALEVSQDASVRGNLGKLQENLSNLDPASIRKNLQTAQGLKDSVGQALVRALEQLPPAQHQALQETLRTKSIRAALETAFTKSPTHIAPPKGNGTSQSRPRRNTT